MNQRGMNVVHEQVLNGPGWFIRNQTESDFGIDAQVEVVDDHGDPAGRLLSLQVKSGPSWFRRPLADGWDFPFDEWHRDYWLNHTLPVVVVLVDVDARQAYWRLIEASTVERTGKRFKVFVPRANRISSASAEWTHLAGEVAAKAPGRWPEVLTSLPPGTARALRRLHSAGAGSGSCTVAGSSAVAAAVLASHLADGRRDPARTARTLLLADPVWLSSQGSRGWSALAAYAVEHDHPALSGEVLLRAVSAGTEQHEAASELADLLAVAALRLSGADASQARAVADEALRLDPSSPRVAVVRCVIDQDADDAAPFTLPADLDLQRGRAADDVVIRALLADDARRRREPDREVRLRTELWEVHEKDSSASLALAVALMRRAGTRQRQQDDEQQARSLLESALAERRRWAGPTLDVLHPLLGLLMSQGDARAVLTAALEPPDGTAAPAEARRQEVLRLAVQAARELREEALARRLAQGLDGAGASLLLRAAVTGEPLDPVVEETALRDALAEALVSDHAQALGLVLTLAQRGVDASAELDALVERSVVSETHQEFAAALALAHADLDAGVPRLRLLAQDDAIVAEELVQVLADADRVEDALAVCDQAQVRFPHGHFTAQRAALLHDAGRTAEAVLTARSALAEGGLTGIAAARLHHLLAQDAIDGRRWSEAERQLATAVSLQRPPPARWVWNLVVAMLHQHQPRRAVELLRRYRPAVRDVQDARLWMGAWQHLPLDAEAAEEALELAEQFCDDAKLSASLLSSVVLVTRTEEDPAGVGDPRHVVPGELHRRAFAAMREHSTRHGAASPFEWRTGTTEELAEQAVAQLRDHHARTAERAEEVADLVERVQHGQLPAGLLSAAVGHGYVEGLLQRDAGGLVAGSPVDDEHEAEVAAASAALQGAVVVDASVLVLLTEQPRGQHLLVRFPRVITTSAVVADSVGAAGRLLRSLATTATLTWDPELQRPREWVDPPGRRARAAARAQTVADSAQGLEADEVPLQTLRDVLGGEDDDLGGAPTGGAPSEAADGADVVDEEQGLRRDAPWMSALALARERGWPLWCDDLGLRRLARVHHVVTFGTPALLEAEVREDIEHVDLAGGARAGERLDAVLERFAGDMRALAADRVVDVPVTLEVLLELAQEEEWEPGAAAVVLARPLWWSAHVSALRGLQSLLAGVAVAGAHLAGWARAAMLGAARAHGSNPIAASTLLAAVAVIAEQCSVADERNGEAADVRGEHLRIASDVAGEHGLADPAEVEDDAVRLVAKVLGER